MKGCIIAVFWLFCCGLLTWLTWPRSF
ncbi:hypothetical protein EYU44_17535 [Vibrio cholerae]|nr:hypothetical protein [Vibrio cholerae]